MVPQNGMLPVVHYSNTIWRAFSAAGRNMDSNYWLAWWWDNTVWQSSLKTRSGHDHVMTVDCYCMIGQKRERYMYVHKSMRMPGNCNQGGRVEIHLTTFSWPAGHPTSCWRKRCSFSTETRWLSYEYYSSSRSRHDQITICMPTRYATIPWQENSNTVLFPFQKSWSFSFCKQIYKINYVCLVGSEFSLDMPWIHGWWYTFLLGRGNVAASSCIILHTLMF